MQFIKIISLLIRQLSIKLMIPQGDYKGSVSSCITFLDFLPTSIYFNHLKSEDQETSMWIFCVSCSRLIHKVLTFFNTKHVFRVENGADEIEKQDDREWREILIQVGFNLLWRWWRVAGLLFEQRRGWVSKNGAAFWWYEAVNLSELKNWQSRTAKSVR